MNASDKGLSAEATIGVYGEIKQSEEGVGEITVKKQRWVYKDTKFSDIKIDMKTGVVNVSGSLSLFVEMVSAEKYKLLLELALLFL
jgi:hypothetical protein